MDGRKNNRAPKKEAAAKKKPVTIYETGEDIALLGGLEKARAALKSYFKLLADGKKTKGVGAIGVIFDTK